MCNKEEFLGKLEINGVLVSKRCTEAYITKLGLLDYLDKEVPEDFGTIGERIKKLKYGGGYCKTCGCRTNVSKSFGGFVEYCSEHFHDPKKGVPANNKKKMPSKEELEELYVKERLTLLEISKRLGNVSNVTVRKWFAHYGIELLPHSQLIRERVVPKVSETCKEKYGADHYFSSVEGKRKVREKFIELYGVPYHPIQNPSMEEEAVRAFFDSISPSFVTDTSTVGMELDGLNKELMVAFEYHGLFWHGEDRKSNSLHYRKFKACEEKGIRLFSIYSNEWNDRREQVKGFIRSALGQYDVKMFARNLKFELRPRTDQESFDFFDKHHIQGKPNRATTKEFYCLCDDQGIVSCMSIGLHPRYSHITSLTRMATRSGVIIVGGAKRLLHYALKNHSKIITWSDNRWTQGDMYARLGFSLVNETRQDYQYTNGKKVFSKQSMSKSSIGAPHDVTEEQFAKDEFGLIRIWDCGKKTWIISST